MCLTPLGLRICFSRFSVAVTFCPVVADSARYARARQARAHEQSENSRGNNPRNVTARH